MSSTWRHWRLSVRTIFGHINPFGRYAVNKGRLLDPLEHYINIGFPPEDVTFLLEQYFPKQRLDVDPVRRARVIMPPRSPSLEFFNTCIITDLTKANRELED